MTPPSRSAEDGSLPQRRPSPSSSSGHHAAPFEERRPDGSRPPGRSGAPHGDVDQGRPLGGFALFQSLPNGNSSHPGLPPSGPVAERRPAPPDTSPATTAFRTQPTEDDDDATSIWGGSTFAAAASDEAQDAPNWLRSGSVSAHEPHNGASTRENRHEADGRGGARGGADPDITRFFPTHDR